MRLHSKRRHRLNARQNDNSAKLSSQSLIPQGGQLKPLNDRDMQSIINLAFDMLEQIGMAEAPKWQNWALMGA